MRAWAPWLGRIKASLMDALGPLAGRLPAQNEQPKELRLRHAAQRGDAVAFAPGQAARHDPFLAVMLPADRQPGALAVQALQRQTLRVVCESDAALKADCAGRMVMSGRIADICAELDRMARRADGARDKGHEFTVCRHGAPSP